jgi:hypothetical protein
LLLLFRSNSLVQAGVFEVYEEVGNWEYGSMRRILHFLRSQRPPTGHRNVPTGSLDENPEALLLR